MKKQIVISVILFLSCSTLALNADLATIKKDVITNITQIFNKDISAYDCGVCLDKGNIFCVLGGPNQMMTLEKNLTNKTMCCNNSRKSNCTALYDSNWTCSTIYSDPIQAYNICPFLENNCGPSKVINISQTGLPF